MDASNAVSTKPVPVHLGLDAPARASDEAASAAPRASSVITRHRRNSPFENPSFDWAGHGLEPRWLGMESSDCAAALDPSIYHNHGADELGRFLGGAAHRGELALVIATMGNVNDQRARPLGATADATISLPGAEEYISGARLPTAVTISLADGLEAIDRDLALRLRNGRASDAPWWSLALSGSEWLPGGAGAPTRHEPTGRLEPILIDGLGRPVVATWTAADASQRWYIVPDVCDWDSILTWLVERALPGSVPGALRRARSPLALDPALQTPAEAAAHRALEDLEASYAEQRCRLDDRLEAAKAQAEPIRHGLLYGTSTELENTVAAVLDAAGFTVVNVDELLSDTTSADLLVSFGGKSRLIEVKSASGSASETLLAQLETHLRTWPQLQPAQPVDGGALVVNHQYRLEPDQRTGSVYTRPEFVAALTVPVLSTGELFEWWRASDWAATREAILDNAGNGDQESAVSAAQLSSSSPQRASSIRGARLRLLRRRFGFRAGPASCPTIRK